ncbi:hypothetical protein [Nocardia takedensis]|uniref:hypothetical protein n=1 Tax=Nocardia takedensis TaxID=259390 RepID=UPI0002F4C1FE|nr:hypothetical protein [Nocardia takedensis]
MTDTVTPMLRLLSLGAGVQSTTLALMAVRGELDDFGRLDGAIFADTGWEPPAVYSQVERLEAEFGQVGIPLHRVGNGNLRRDSLDPDHRFVSIPYYTLAPEGTTIREEITETDPDGYTVIVGHRERLATRREREGLGRRQCTSEYKIAPINRAVRMLLGAPAPRYLRVPKGRYAEQWIGFSTDEIQRVNDRRENKYTTKRFPLLELGMSRTDCERYLRRTGWGHTVKSACIGCPHHRNPYWRDLRDNHPTEWADAVAFDRSIRSGGASAEPLRGQAFLHRSCLPLDIAPIDRITRTEWKDRQLDLFDYAADLAEEEDDEGPGCSPYGCVSGPAVTDHQEAA